MHLQPINDFRLTLVFPKGKIIMPLWTEKGQAVLAKGYCGYSGISDSIFIGFVGLRQTLNAISVQLFQKTEIWSFIVKISALSLSLSPIQKSHNL